MAVLLHTGNLRSRYAEKLEAARCQRTRGLTADALFIGDEPVRLRT
jgi:hypothetical protein